MGKSEQKAYNWLLRQGVPKNKIIFQKNRSPNFFLVDGSDKKFDVRRLYGSKILMREREYSELKEHKKHAKILVFRDDRDDPVAIIPFVEIKPGVKVWRDIQIHWVEGKQKVLRIRNDTWEKLVIKRIENRFEDLDQLLNYLLEVENDVKKGS